MKKTLSIGIALCLCMEARGVDILDAPADFTITTNVVTPSPDRFGTNTAINGYADYNNYSTDPGFEPFVVRKMWVANGGGTNHILNSAGATTTNWDVLADGFFDGAAVRVYRSSGGKMGLLRSGTVTRYIGGWNRVTSNRITGTQFKDGGLQVGQTYYYTVRAYDTSGNQSANSNVVTAVAAASDGVGDTVSATFSQVVTDNLAPAAPTGCTATANPDGTVQLSWNANGESDLAGYFIYRAQTDPLEHNRIYISGTGPDVRNGDYYFIDSIQENVPMEKISPRVRSYFSGNDTWRTQGGNIWPYNQPVTKFRDSSTVCPENGGKTSMKLTAPGPSSYEVSLRQFRFGTPDSFYGALTPGKVYTAEVWMRQEGVASGSVAFRMTGGYAAVSHTWSGITSQWQKFSCSFTAPAYPTAGATVEQTLAFTGPGSVWFDNFLLYDPTLEKFQMRPAAKEQFNDYAPGWLRSHTGHTNGMWGSSMEDWTSPDITAMNHFNTNGGRGRPEQPYHLPYSLQWAKDAGANPWLVVGACMNEQEWLNFIEYLAGPAGTPYGQKRIDQRGGNAAPWSSEFSKIRVEWGNEMWNPVFEWTVGGPQHGQFADYFFNVAKSSPYFAALAGKMEFILNGQLVSSGTDGYGPSAAQAVPIDPEKGRAASNVNLALYLGGWDAHIELGGGMVNDAGFSDLLAFSPTFGRYWFDRQTATRDYLATLGVTYKLCNYESGPGYGLPSSGLQFDPVVEAYGKSLAGGIATLDSFLYGTYKKIDPQCYFTFQTGVNWSSHGYLVNGNYPQPSWLALRMRNKYVTGDMLATAANNAPTRDVADWINQDNGAVQCPTVKGMPLVGCYAFRDGTKYSVFVLSRKLTGSTPVTLRLPFNSITSGSLFKLTGDPRARNDQGTLNIQPSEEAVTGFSAPFSFQLPAGSAYLYVFEGANTQSESAPSCTISQGIGQADPASTQTISFLVHFSQPVTGFDSSDVILGGNALPGAVSVTEVDPYLGTDYRVTVSGMSTSGSVTISIPAGAAVNASGQGNLAPVNLDNTVQFNMAPFVAYDDFNFPPATAPYPPFLASVNAGAGWAGPWQLANFNYGSYADGYKLAAATPLSYLNLRRKGSYAIGGKNYDIAARALDVDNTFAFYRVADTAPSVIGRNGTTLWVSVLMRKETADNSRALLTFSNLSALSVTAAPLGIGFCGDSSVPVVNGIRYWSMQLRSASGPGFDVVRTNVPVVTGQTALLVAKMTFGTSDRVDLFVNPALSGTAPSSPDASLTTSGTVDLNFHSIGFSGGTNGSNQASIDEIRFGTTFADVTPVFTASETWRQTWFDAPEETGPGADTADPDGDGVPNLLEYAFGTNPAKGDRPPLPSAFRSQIAGHEYLTLEVPKAAADLQYAIEVSNDLVHWSSDAAHVEVLADTSALLRVRDLIPAESATQRFIRARISR